MDTRHACRSPRRAKRAGQISQEVRCNERRFANFVASEIAGEPVQVYTQLGRREGLESLPNEGCNEPGQHITATTGRHAGISSSIAVKSSAIADERLVPLEDEYEAKFAGKGRRQRVSVRLDVGHRPSRESGEFSRMRR